MDNNYLEEERYIRAQKRVKKIKGFYWHLFYLAHLHTYFFNHGLPDLRIKLVLTLFCLLQFP